MNEVFAHNIFNRFIKDIMSEDILQNVTCISHRDKRGVAIKHRHAKYEMYANKVYKDYVAKGLLNDGFVVVGEFDSFTGTLNVSMRRTDTLEIINDFREIVKGARLWKE